MAVYSMTGYASGQTSAFGAGSAAAAPANAQARLGVELRSVNSRFLDLTLRLPDDFRAHEAALREAVGKRIKRGKIELRAFVDTDGAAPFADPPTRLLQRLASLQDQVLAWLPEAQPIGVADAIRLAGTEVRASAEMSDALLPLVDRTLGELVSAREREGARLATLVRERAQQLRQLAAGAEPLIPRLIEAQRQRFLERWAEALGAAESSVPAEARQERALTEAAAFAIRIDVAEELGRLKAHLDEIDSVLAKGGEVGKRLDFLIQELHREANTLGSKSATLELTRIAVDMKVLIEQMREQVQNIE